VEHRPATIEATERNRLVTETRGDPLAILDAVATLSEAELLGQTPITHPPAIGVSLERTLRNSWTACPAIHEPRCLLPRRATQDRR
jgi:hypothetical protein